ncbi:MAG: UDP-3-O-acyl-N-acetylglucosamine deacetylase [Kiritimatiellae bacterium]|nr:UDP-3-O-acyl-N-acetylglucosamine deacetylase [Kiritimatiellia bacterium]
MWSSEFETGRLLAGNQDDLSRAVELWREQPIDDVRTVESMSDGFSRMRTTIAHETSVTGPGTFAGKFQRTLRFKPSKRPGWWIKRTDQTEQLPIEVAARNIWTAARNIVLRSGNPHNYLRMVEHIVALRNGLGIDDLVLETDSGDPPLFERSSMDIVESLEEAGIVDSPSGSEAQLVTVREPVSICGDRGDFVTLLPAPQGWRKLRMDVSIDWKSVIGRQRIVFDVTRDNFVFGAAARTNATERQMALVKTIGWLFADMRNLGYTRRNILIHGKRRFVNEPVAQFNLNGRNFEPVWHRATLDLLAAIALLEGGRFVGTAISYRAGHRLDTRFMTLIELKDLLVRV